MDLGNVFQVLLFLLPGFVFLRAFLLFAPSRRGSTDAEVIVESIAGSAAIWLVASVMLFVLSGIITAIGMAARQPWHPNLWAGWLQPAFTFNSPSLAAIWPGLVVNLVALVAGPLVAGLVLEESGNIRVFQLRHGPRFIKRLRLDLNPRVWGWFFQEGSEGSLYRLTLNDQRVLVGQITEYSSDPNDDVMDLVLRGYSVWNGKAWVAMRDGERLLLRRDDIILIERLTQPVRSYISGEVSLPVPVPKFSGQIMDPPATE